MVHVLFEFGLLCFLSMFTMVNPLSVLPIYLSMTGGLTHAQARQVAAKAVLTAAGVLVLFALAGQLVFSMFSVSVDSLRVVGGVILFLLGYEMLQARLSRTKHDDETPVEFADDIAITPLGIPMIAGPGAITTAILLMNSADRWEKKAVFFATMGFALALSFVSLLAAKRLVALLGGNLNKVLMRLMGLIVMMIAVEFFFTGLKAIVKGMLPG